MFSRKLLFVLALGLGAGGCYATGSASMRTSGSAVVYQEPPAPQLEQPSSPRPGFIWVRGRWDWRGGQWTWIDGHWERERAGYAWNEGRWERRGNGWYWVEGSWTSGGGGRGTVHDTSGASGGTVVTPGAGGGHSGHHGGHGHGHGHGHAGGSVDTSNASGGTVVSGGAGNYPTAAPPPPRSESYSAKAGFVWVTGRWDWRGGRWEWVDGHWERERANMVWIPGRWELQGNYYVWIDGRWGPRGSQQQQGGPVIRDHR
ncbi:MAG TPA: hypothetical protein VK427_20970 [Kofleriaceae bacterium]|nr:hypothetical protein [Kofleriaceae bacterium]